MAYQLNDAGAIALITCSALLPTVFKALKSVRKIPKKRVFVIDGETHKSRKTIEQLIQQGKQNSKPLPPLILKKGENKTKLAFICYSSGTTGLPKGVMISHYNVISNILQVELLERNFNAAKRDITILLLPLYHIYGISSPRFPHSIIFSKYRPELRHACRFVYWKYLCYRPCIRILFLPNLHPKLQNDKIVSRSTSYCPSRQRLPNRVLQSLKSATNYQRSCSLRKRHNGPPPFKIQKHHLQTRYPSHYWLSELTLVAYGMTESAPVITAQLANDQIDGSSGPLLPNMQAKLMDPITGKEITSYNTPGELWVCGPNVTIGYLHKQKETKETWTFDEQGRRWLHTGDEVEVRRSEKGQEHYWIVDRIKELIKVRGFQVPPAELEALLLSHEIIEDAAVIGIHDDYSGELPKAFVVLKAGMKASKEVESQIKKFVEERKARYKWLSGGIEFIDSIPKTPSGKILRKDLRLREKNKAKTKGAKAKL